MKKNISDTCKHIIALITAAAIPCMLPFSMSAETADTAEVFYDDFTGSRLDTSKWLAAEKNWGGTVNVDGKTVDYNGGVIAENIAIQDGNLVLTGLGNLYEGELQGINRDGSRRLDGKRCGGAVATKDYYGSGSYEIRAKIAPVLGCCSAMWTFEYEEDYSDDALKIVNHEIDIEFPGRDDNDDFSLSHALCTTWIGEGDDEHKTGSPYCGNQADGTYHTYRFDWHTGNDAETPRVEYYFDDVLTYISYDYIPTNESRFWLGLWFPKYWAGTPDFDTTEFLVDYVKITPFHESGDTPQHESYPDSGWADLSQDADLPKGWLLWHSYSEYTALDSKLYLRTPDNVITNITGDFVHAMNGSFGATPEQITFMAIDSESDEWDIYVYENGNITNLTKNSGFRNEDPKWSPDGKSIVFKRGHWEQDVNDFIYNLALLDMETGEITMLSNDSTEEAMPYFSEDGKFLYYTSYTDGIGSICRMNMESYSIDTIFCEDSVTAYYPILKGDFLYFTKWRDSNNHCDQIMCFDGKEIYSLPFNSTQYDCSDACPIHENAVIYSSTADGDYDLYYYDGENTAKITPLNSDRNDLGADFYAWEDYESYLESIRISGDINADGVFDISDVIFLQKWLLAVPDTELNNWHAADFYNDHVLNVFDLCLMKQELLKSIT